MEYQQLRVILIGLFSLLRVTTPVFAHSDNLIVNGDFEEGFHSNGLAKAWVDDSRWAPVKVLYEKDSTTPHSGKACQKIISKSYLGGSVQFRQNRIKIINSNLYNISLWMKGTVTSPVSIGIRKSRSPYHKYIYKIFNATQTWQKFEFQDIAFTSDEDAIFHIVFSSEGELFIDDVALYEIGEQKKNPYIFLEPPDTQIPHNYFGMHIHRYYWNPRFKNNWPRVPFGTWRTHDSNVQWSKIEPSPKKYVFNILDEYVERANREGIEILYNFVHTPDWASSCKHIVGTSIFPNKKKKPRSCPPVNIDDWISFVRVVAQRYKGKIKYYEIWNEPNSLNFWQGSIEELIALQKAAYTILKEVDPNVQVVSPSVVKQPLYFAQMLEAGFDQYADIIGYHFYTQPSMPEMMIPDIQRIKRILNENGIDKPLWNTEAGWKVKLPDPIARKGIDIETAGKYLARSLIIQWASGIDRFYFYAYDDRIMGIFDQFNNQLYPNATPYITTHGWLAGSTMHSLSATKDNTWTSLLSMHGGQKAAIIWNPFKNMEYIPPKTWQIEEIETLYGERIKPGLKLWISDAPILIRYRVQTH
ncbi:MAG: carbohydrate binding domain-containing protein [Sedimenticola sp.]